MIKLNQTSAGHFLEQYLAFDNSATIGYIRLRRGCLSAVYEYNDKEIHLLDIVFPDATMGSFKTEEQRTKYLDICKELLKEYHEEAKG